MTRYNLKNEQHLAVGLDCLVPREINPVYHVNYMDVPSRGVLPVPLPILLYYSRQP